MCGLFSPIEDANEGIYTSTVFTPVTQYTIHDSGVTGKKSAEQQQKEQAAIAAGELACQNEDAAAIGDCIIAAYKGITKGEHDPDHAPALEGGNYNFWYGDVEIGNETFNPAKYGGCSGTRCGDIPSLHYDPAQRTIHLDTANPYIGVNVLIHFVIDVVLGHTLLRDGISRPGGI